MHIMSVDDTSSSSLSSSMSETSSILSSISSCCSHNAIDFDSSNVDNVSNGNHRTSLQFILNQNQNNNSSDYWEFNNNIEEEDLNQEYDDNYYYYNSYYPDSHFDTSHHQFDSEYYNQYTSSHGKLIPPPSPPPEVDLLENNQILSSDEFNSIFESFTAVVEGHKSNNNNTFIEDGCLRGTNCNNGFLDDEQLSKALGAIAMI